MRDDNKSQFCLLPSRERERENERDDIKEENFLASGKKVNFLSSKTTVSQIYVDNSPTFSSSSSHQSLVLRRSRSLVLRYRSIRRLLSSISYSSWTSVPLGRLFLRFRSASSSLYLSLSKIVFVCALYYPHDRKMTMNFAFKRKERARSFAFKQQQRERER